MKEAGITENRGRQEIVLAKPGRVLQRRLIIEGLVTVVAPVISSVCFSLLIPLALLHKCFLSFSF